MTELNRLGYSPVELQAVVDPLVEARLLTLDRDPITRGPTIEVAHEALLTEWARLADWVESQPVFRSSFAVIARAGHPRLARAPISASRGAARPARGVDGKHRAVADDS